MSQVVASSRDARSGSPLGARGPSGGSPATGLRLAHSLMAMHLSGLALSMVLLATGPAEPPAAATPALARPVAPSAPAGSAAVTAQFQDTLAVNDILVPVLVRTRSG